MAKICGFLSAVLIMTWSMSHAHANVASKNYVDNITSTKISAEASATQDMAGQYTVTGSLKVPTQPLPTAE